MTPHRSSIRRPVAGLALAALTLGLLPAVATGATAPMRLPTACSADAPVVGKASLRTRAGVKLGTAKLLFETVGGDTIACGVAEIRKPFRTSSTQVTIDLRERSETGVDLGRAMSSRPATKVVSPSQAASFVPTGSTFTLRLTIDTGPSRVTAKTRYTVP